MLNRILSLIGWLGTALVIVAVAIRFGYPAKDQYAFYLAWAGLACVLVYTLGQWREIATMFGRRQTRYGTLAGVSLLVVLGILIAVNYIGARQNKRWDLTSVKAYSLSEQSKSVLSKLDAPMQVLVFAKETDLQRYKDKLNEYEYNGKKVSAQYIDPDKKPALARQNNVQQYGTIVFNYKGRTERVTNDAEQDITNGIIKVVTGRQKKVYFSQGHGEKDTGSSERDGYSAVSAALTGENYTVEKLVLAQQSAVPDDAAVVIIAGPKTDFFPPEIDALKKYLDKAGKVLLELDPPDKPGAAAAPNLMAFAHDWGMDVGNNIVVDASGMGRLFGADYTVPVAASYPSHPITSRFNLITAFPLARSVTAVMGGVNGHIAQSFIETSPRSWAETDIKGVLSGDVPEMQDAKGDKPGPVSLGGAVNATPTTPAAAKPGENADAPKPETRAVVIGDSDFASNAVLGIQGNRDLFMNIVGWLSQQETLISIRPRDPDDRRVTLTAAQQANLTWLSLLIIPGFIFGTGVYAWWRRR